MKETMKKKELKQTINRLTFENDILKAKEKASTEMVNNKVPTTGVTSMLMCYADVLKAVVKFNKSQDELNK